LPRRAAPFEPKRGGGGHLIVWRGDGRSELPMHGSRKQLGTGLVNRILKDLGLK
jgi:mRNA interferase HicA